MRRAGTQTLYTIYSSGAKHHFAAVMSLWWIGRSVVSSGAMAELTFSIHLNSAPEHISTIICKQNA
jgi:hypothetical protein